MPSESYLLLETGGYLLQETGKKIILDAWFRRFIALTMKLYSRAQTIKLHSRALVMKLHDRTFTLKSRSQED